MKSSMDCNGKKNKIQSDQTGKEYINHLPHEMAC